MESMMTVEKDYYFKKLNNIKIREYTSPYPIYLTNNSTLSEALQTMKDYSFRHIPVIENNKLQGIISKSDLLLNIDNPEFNNISVQEIMTKDVYTVNENSTLDEVAFNMSDKKIGSAVVLADNNDIVGIFTTTDALNALIEIIRGEIEVD